MSRSERRRKRRENADVSPEGLEALRDRLLVLGREAGLDAIGVTSAEPFDQARAAIEHRKENGLHDTMSFTFTKPERSTDPGTTLPGAATVIVGARSYRRQESDRPSVTSGRIARYSWVDHYAPLRSALRVLGVELRQLGFRARVMADDNALVDRAAAQRAGIGWFGKNANILLPGQGSWFVLGSLVTDAPLPVTADVVADGCGSCVRCIDGCPTDAIIAPGVVDARRCLAWLVQKPGVFPLEFREKLGDRIYGCDDCQEVCPPNRTIERKEPARLAEPDAQPWSDLLRLLESTDDELFAAHGRFYLPGRDINILRRNALLALGNIVAESIENPQAEGIEAALVSGERSVDPAVVDAAEWARERWSRRRQSFL